MEIYPVTNIAEPTQAQKVCSHCGVSKPLSEFHKNSKTKDGHQSWCKSCTINHVAEKRKQAAESAPTPPHVTESTHPVFSKMTPREIQNEIRERVNYLRHTGWECSVSLKYTQVREIVI